MFFLSFNAEIELLEVVPITLAELDLIRIWNGLSFVSQLKTHSIYPSGKSRECVFARTDAVGMHVASECRRLAVSEGSNVDLYQFSALYQMENLDSAPYQTETVDRTSDSHQCLTISVLSSGKAVGTVCSALRGRLLLGKDVILQGGYVRDKSQPEFRLVFRPTADKHQFLDLDTSIASEWSDDCQLMVCGGASLLKEVAEKLLSQLQQVTIEKGPAVPVRLSEHWSLLFRVVTEFPSDD